MKSKIGAFKAVLFRWLFVALAITLILAIVIIRARPIVISYAQSHAKAQMISAFDVAVKSALLSLEYSYNDLAVVTRLSDNTVSSIEIDYAKLNTLRSEISKTISDEIYKKSENVLKIPIGTLLGSEYTTGYGPYIKFKLKFSHIPLLDFESNFRAAGINSVFHQIIIKANLSCGIIMLGADKTFSVDLSAIAAQTVIQGAVPDNFTNVVETPDSTVADDIFNFSQ
ncbi:MAG: sporulation protein YunB [Clostridia bacterium]|nr:sporulation protein YunB [Clostridia bacterium]